MQSEVTDEMVAAYKAGYDAYFTRWLNNVAPNNDSQPKWEATRSGLEAALSAAPPAQSAAVEAEPVALIQSEVLAALVADKTATGTVCSPLLKKPFGDPVALYSADTLAALQQRLKNAERWRDFERSSRLTSEAQLGGGITHAKARITALEEQLQRVREVKALDWRYQKGPREKKIRCWIALTTVGTYWIDLKKQYWVNVPAPDTRQGRTYYSTIEEAKAAAQADYEARIRAALSPLDGAASEGESR